MSYLARPRAGVRPEFAAAVPSGKRAAVITAARCALWGGTLAGSRGGGLAVGRRLRRVRRLR